MTDQRTNPAAPTGGDANSPRDAPKPSDRHRQLDGGNRAATTDGPAVTARPRNHLAGGSLVIVVLGAVGAALLGLGTGTSMHDAIVLSLLATGGALVAATVGWIVLAPLRRRPVRYQAAAVALIVVTGTAVGIAATARAMFISSHDLNALMVVLVAAGSAGAAAGLRLGARIEYGSLAVAELARGIGDGSAHQAPGSPPQTPELARLAEEISRVSAELAEARQRELALEQSRRELVAWISHDLRGPLTSIRAMAEAMEDHVVDDGETVDRYHRAIRGETERLSAMVDDLFELSRITSGVTDMQLRCVPLADVVDEAVQTLAARAEQAGVLVERRYRDLPSIEISVPEFSRALHNLLDNAIRHTPSGGRVTVEGEPTHTGAVVAVEDQCGGIPDEDLMRVFDMAFRGDTARRRDGGGGLGLTIAKGIVEAHHGSLDVRNRERGCRFTIRLSEDGQP